MFIAQVIVDVPTMQTDQPYSYLIPENLSDVVSVGMRVEVPFGNGNRHIFMNMKYIEKRDKN